MANHFVSKKTTTNTVPDTSQRTVKRILQNPDLLQHMRVETFELRKNLLMWQTRIFVLDTESRTLCNYKNDSDLVTHNMIDLRQSDVSVNYNEKEGTMEISSPSESISIRGSKDKKKLQQFCEAITSTITGEYTRQQQRGRELESVQSAPFVKPGKQNLCLRMQAFTSFANVVLHGRGRKLNLLTDAPPKVFIMLASALHGADEGILLLNADDEDRVWWRHTIASLAQLGVVVNDISIEDLTKRDVSAYLALFWRIFSHFASGVSDIVLFRRGLYQWIRKIVQPFANVLMVDNSMPDCLSDGNLYLAILLSFDSDLFDPAIIPLQNPEFAFKFASEIAWRCDLHIPSIIDPSLVAKGMYDEAAFLMQLALYKIMMDSINSASRTQLQSLSRSCHSSELEVKLIPSQPIANSSGSNEKETEISIPQVAKDGIDPLVLTVTNSGEPIAREVQIFLTTFNTVMQNEQRQLSFARVELGASIVATQIVTNIVANYQIDTTNGEQYVIAVEENSKLRALDQNFRVANVGPTAKLHLLRYEP